MEDHSTYGGKGHWAGPIVAIVLIAIALIVIAWLDVGLIDTLMHS
jgi:hypothetical protein